MQFTSSDIKTDGEPLNLRDIFAIAAAQALLQNPNVAKFFSVSGFLRDDSEWQAEIAVASFRVADAMVTARAAKNRTASTRSRH